MDGRCCDYIHGDGVNCAECQKVYSKHNNNYSRKQQNRSKNAHTRVCLSTYVSQHARSLVPRSLPSLRNNSMYDPGQRSYVKLLHGGRRDCGQSYMDGTLHGCVCVGGTLHVCVCMGVTLHVCV